MRGVDVGNLPYLSAGWQLGIRGKLGVSALLTMDVGERNIDFRGSLGCTP